MTTVEERTSTARLKRDDIMQTNRLSDCENFVHNRKKLVFDTFLVFSQCRDVRTAAV